MNEWDEKAEHVAYLDSINADTGAPAEATRFGGFLQGARWQREALRSDEVVERAAQAYRAHTTAVLARENLEHLVCAECGWAFGWQYDTEKDANRQSEHGMRAALTAALGEDESDD